MGYINPLLRLPAMQDLLAMPAEQRAPLEALMRDLRSDADREAESAWRRRKGPMAAYWRAVSTYARHVAHALGKGHASEATGPRPVLGSSVPVQATWGARPKKAARPIAAETAGEEMPRPFGS